MGGVYGGELSSPFDRWLKGLFDSGSTNNPAPGPDAAPDPSSGNPPPQDASGGSSDSDSGSSMALLYRPVYFGL